MILELIDPANYSFNLVAVPTFVTAAAIICLGFLILVGEKDSPVSIAFFLMTLSVGLWLFSYSWMYCSTDPRVAAAWVRIGHLGVTFIPASVYHFTVGTLRIFPGRRRLVQFGWLVSAVFFVTVAGGESFVGGVNRYWWGFYAKYGWVSFPFLVFFFAMMALSLQSYWVEYHKAPPGTAKLRSKALLVAFSVAYIGSFDFLAALGIPLYPFGYLPVLCFIVMTARTIWRYRLVDITPEFAAKEIINAMDDALLVLDHDGVVRVANRGACELFGKTEPELLGVHIRTLATAISRSESELDRLILTGSLRDFEFPSAESHDGTATLSSSSFVMRDQADNPIAFVCMIRDVTAQKEAEREIQRHTERQAALYDINLATTSTLELRAVLDRLLERLKSLIPDAATTIMLLGPDHRELVKVASRNVDDGAWKMHADPDGSGETHPVLRRKAPLLVADIQSDPDALHSGYFRENGYTSYLGVPLLAKDTVVGMLSLYTKGRRRFDDEEVNFFRTLAGQAASAIHNSQLYEQTRQQAVDLERASRVKDEFLGVMSHELRTPLNVISGFTKLVQEGTLGSINPDQLRALETVTRHSNELLLMVNSIMDASKIEAGAIVLDLDDCPLTAFLDELRLLYDMPTGKEVALRWEFPSDLPTVRTDREKLKHVIQNLINNAVKFTEKGEVVVSARYDSETDRVEFRVRDTGAGIDKANLPVIFEIFRQLDSSRTRSHGGVGIGLHIVKTFTGILGGAVAVESEPGKGSTFIVTVPRITRDKKSTSGAAPGSAGNDA